MGFSMSKKPVDPLAETQLYFSGNGLSYCSNPLGLPISCPPGWMEAYVLAVISRVEHR